MTAAAAALLGMFLVAVGISHFLVPRYFRTLVPAWVPAPGAVVAVSGAVEVVVGVLVLVPASRVVGAWAAAALITAYLASHIDAARTATAVSPRFLDRPAGAVARLVVNLAYIGWAVLVALGAATG